MAYYAARAALVSWGSEFGYELVGQDWKLAYPPADPQLAELAQRTIGEARVRQRQLMLAAPRSYSGDKISFRSNPTRGGFVEDRGRGGRGAGGKLGGGGGAGGTAGGGDSPFPLGTRGRSGGGSGSAAGTGSGSGGESGSTKSTAGGGSGGASSLGADAESKPNKSGKDGNSSVESLAKKRGRDWGLPDASQAAVAVTRPVFLECRPDRLVILPEEGTGGGKEIALGGKTQEAVEDLVSAVWAHMKTWGIAGKGLYWKPTLLMDVAPGAEARYAELETLLADSGLEVKRRQKNVAGGAGPQATQR
jgi:hypothetical protein